VQRLKHSYFPQKVWAGWWSRFDLEGCCSQFSGLHVAVLRVMKCSHKRGGRKPLLYQNVDQRQWPTPLYSNSKLFVQINAGDHVLRRSKVFPSLMSKTSRRVQVKGGRSAVKCLAACYCEGCQPML